MSLTHRLLPLAIAALLAIAAMSVMAAPASAHGCGQGIYAGKHTSCGLAKAVFQKTGRVTDKVHDGQRLWVKSPVTGKRYAFFLYRGDWHSFTVRARGQGNWLAVRINL